MPAARPKKHLPARLAPSHSRAAQVIVAQVVEAIGREVAPHFEMIDRIENAVKNLTGGTSGAVQGHKESFFLRRLEAMAAYGRGESSADEAWIERDLADAHVPRGALSVASAFGVSRELIEQVYAQYVTAYEAAFRRFRERYPEGRAPGRCFACGREGTT